MCLLLAGATGVPAQERPRRAECFGREATIIGTRGDDVLTGTRDGDAIAGLGGDDVIRGLDGNDALCGGDGDDVIEGAAGLDAVILGRGADSGTGGPGFDFVGEFYLDGCGPCSPIDPRSRDVSVDLVSGGAGPDWVSAEGGNDVVDGGSGQDFAYHLSRFTSVTVDLDAGIAMSSAGGVDELRSIEHVGGSVNADTLRGDSGENWLFGSLGPDEVDGRDGPDTLSADLLGDVLVGGDDDSTDTVRVSLQEPAYVDLAAGTASSREVDHGHLGDRIVGFENAVGTSYDDVLVGDDGDNLLHGGFGRDELIGAGGDDRLFGDFEWRPSYGRDHVPGSDVLDGGAGRDRLDGGALVDECSNGEVYISCELRRSDDQPRGAARAASLPWWWSGIDLDYGAARPFAAVLFRTLR